MAGPTNNLWLLVQSLTPQEKLFFRRDYVKAHNFSGNEPLYLQMFDSLNKQSSYDEAKLMKQLAPALTAKNISYTKNYLHEQLCDALLYFHNHENADARISQQLSLIRIFREKGLYKTALKIWESAMKQAALYEQYPLIQLLKEEYRRLQLYSNPKATYEKLLKDYMDNVLSTEEYAQLLQLQELHFHALLLRRKAHFRQTKDDIKNINALLKHPLLSNPPTSISFIYNHYYKMSLATLLYLKNDPESYKYAYKNIHAWQGKPLHISYDQENYLEVLYIFYYTAILAKDYQHIIDVMHNSANKLVKGSSHVAYFETIKHLALNRVYNKLADYHTVKMLVTNMKLHIDEWEQSINTDMQRTLRLSLGISCFVLQDYEDAYHYVKNAILLFNDDTREEHYSFGHLFLLLICFEKRDDYLFELQYKSTYSYFYRHEQPLPFEKAILHTLNKTYLSKSFRELQQNFTQLQETLKLSASDPVQQIVFSMFNIPAWIESKLHRVPYKEWVQKELSNTLALNKSAS